MINSFFDTVRKFCLLLYFMSSLVLFSQNIDDRILDVYSQTDLERQIMSNPNRMIYLNIKVKESYRIEKVTELSTENIFDYLNTEVFSRELIHEQMQMNYPFDEFNVFLYKVGRDHKSDKVFKLGNSGYQVRFLSNQSIMKLYNSKIVKK